MWYQLPSEGSSGSILCVFTHFHSDPILFLKELDV